MNRYNKESQNGKAIVARFCSCGHSAIIVSASSNEHDQHEQEWDITHSGPDHALVNFDTWIASILNKSLSTAP